jgi:putative ABC transport system permease protein
VRLWYWRTPPVPPTRLRIADLAGEAFDNVVARPGRALLTVLGTVLGTAAFVAILGMTTTASQQISAAFTAEVATQVTVTDHPAQSEQSPVFPFPDGTEARLLALHGVFGAGIFWATGPGGGQTATEVTTLPLGVQTDTQPVQLGITAATPGYLAAIGATVSEGRLYGQFQQDTAQPVCVLGAAAARSLEVTDLTGNPAVFINGIPVTVIGIVGNSAYQQAATISNVFVPSSLAIKLWGNPQPQTDPASVFIVTALGAASQVGLEAPYAINPEDPGRYQVSVPPNPDQELGGNVSRSLTGLFYALAGVSLLIGAAGITNTTLVAVLERIKEIGLRRTFGAGRTHIVAQFMAEAAALGLFGGIAGAALGAWAVVAVATTQHWTPVISPITLLPAPLVGAATGLVAGLYPALRASRIEPVEALRT